MGFVAVSCIILIFMTIIFMGTRIAIRAPDEFGALLSAGITAKIGIESLVNLSMAMGLLPTKGTPLPFVSYGGSSLLVNLMGVGILLSIAGRKEGKRERS
jgi:cell division protein FtsW